jgi:hypothetical protein
MSECIVYGFTWQGAWNDTQTYNPYDVVQRNGSSYNAVAPMRLAH